MLTIFKGATFQTLGAVQIDGVPQDCTSWTIDAGVYNLQGTTQYSDLPITWINQGQGLFSLGPVDTSDWPAGKARIDMRVDTGTEVLLSPPEYIRVQESPLS
jgi:hypothetical protein